MFFKLHLNIYLRRELTSKKNSKENNPILPPPLEVDLGFITTGGVTTGGVTTGGVVEPPAGENMTLRKNALSLRSVDAPSFLYVHIIECSPEDRLIFSVLKSTSPEIKSISSPSM